MRALSALRKTLASRAGCADAPVASIWLGASVREDSGTERLKCELSKLLRFDSNRERKNWFGITARTACTGQARARASLPVTCRRCRLTVAAPAALYCLLRDSNSGIS